MSKLYAIKTVVLLVYLVAVISLLTNAATRRNPGIRVLLWLLLVYAATMTFYDNTKEVKYGVHLAPLYDAVTAIWVVWCWRAGTKVRWLGAAAAAAFAAVGAGGLLYTTFVKDEYHRNYLPAANYVKSHEQPGDLVLAGSEFGFAFGFDSNTVDDTRFTFLTHKTPEFIVLSENYRAMIENSRKLPDQYAFVEKLFREKYHPVYAVGGYEIVQRNK